MGALANAATLRLDATFILWVEAASAYNARLVILEADTTPDHEIRLKLAKEVAVSPASISALMVTAVACDPDVATKGNTAAAVTETLIIDKVAGAWTKLAQLTHPNG